jgi:AcrR family transcriptional regulator
LANNHGVVARAELESPRRLTAEERRQEVLEAAITEFGRRGFHATRTADIAQRAGVSQPYVYALFPDKRALFLACHARAMERIRETLVEARARAADGEPLEAQLGRAYREMIESRPDQLLFQLQAHAAAADPEIRESVRASFIALVDESVHLHDGASRQVVLGYIARALMQNVALALDLPDDYRLEP